MNHSIHAIIHPLESGGRATRLRRVFDGFDIEILDIHEVAQSGFPRSFEQVAEELQQCKRFFFEPDGSFVWVNSENCREFQLDGNLMDDGHHVAFMEIKGECTAGMLDRLLTSLGWPSQLVLFQLMQSGLFVDETEFRRLFVRPRDV